MYNIYDMTNHTQPTKKYKCECFNSTSGTTKNANFFNGNTNQPGYLVTEPFLYSTLVRTSHNQNAGKTVFQNMSNKMNAFGRWEGAPGGSGQPPKNSF